MHIIVEVLIDRYKSIEIVQVLIGKALMAKVPSHMLSEPALRILGVRH